MAKFFRQTQKITADACGVSLSTVKRITTKDVKSINSFEPVASTSRASLTTLNPSFASPPKNYKRAKYATAIDDFDIDIVQRTIHEFYDNREYPTTIKLLNKYREKINCNGSKTSMWRILKSLHFKYKKCNDGRKFLMERNDIVLMRVKFLRKMCNLHQNNDTQPVVYLDETWVNQNHTREHIWQNNTNSEGLKVPIGKGSCLIICHARSSSFGFVAGSKLVFCCQSSTNIDYHTQMNSITFKEWFIQMLNNLEEPCV